MNREAVLDWRGGRHQVWETWQAAKTVKPGYRFPAVRQTFEKPGGSKIQRRYYQAEMKDLLKLNGWRAFLVLLRRGAVLFNKLNKKHIILGYIKYPLGKDEFVIGENVLCDLNRVRIVDEATAFVKVGNKKVRQKFYRIAPTTATLREVIKGSSAIGWATPRWRVMPSPKTGEIWISAEDVTLL